MKKKPVFVRSIVALLVVIPLIFIIIAMMAKHPNQQNQQITAPTVEPITKTNDVNPSPSYTTRGQDKLLDYVQHRRPLSQEDKNAKTNILSLLPAHEESGIIYENPDISIEYVHEPDLFQIEIKTANVSYAKSQAIAWFKQQGVSQAGICRYPVSFYLNFELLNEIKKQHASFDPLPVGC